MYRKNWEVRLIYFLAGWVLGMLVTGLVINIIWIQPILDNLLIEEEKVETKTYYDRVNIE